MKLLLSMVLLTTSTACSGETYGGFGIDLRKKLQSGIYQSLEKVEYHVSSSGPAALTVQGPDNLCLLFWAPSEEAKIKDPSIVKSQIVTLSGQNCKGGKFEVFDWRAVYSRNNLTALILVPQGVFTGTGAKPIELRFVREGRWKR